MNVFADSGSTSTSLIAAQKKFGKVAVKMNKPHPRAKYLTLKTLAMAVLKDYCRGQERQHPKGSPVIVPLLELHFPITKIY